MGFIVSIPWSSFRVRLAFSSEVKGWRLFLIADARAPFPSDLPAAEPDEREKGTPRSTDPRMSGKNTSA
jgi:hypothetical protein